MDVQHLMGIPFQCDIFHIIHIEGQNLMARDEEILIFLRMENMDECWGKELSTGGGELVSLRIMRIDALEGELFLYPLTQLEPFPLEDSVVTRPEVLVPQQSLKPGIYQDYLQWYKTRSYSEVYGNICSAGVIGLGLDTLEIEDRNMVVTTIPNRGKWFESFIRGNKKRMGVIKIKNFGLL